MRHINSVFHDVLKQVPWARFDKLVASMGRTTVRKLTTRNQFTALLFGQLRGRSRCARSKRRWPATAVGFITAAREALKRSTFADANRLRDVRSSAICSRRCWGRLRRAFAASWATRCA